MGYTNNNVRFIHLALLATVVVTVHFFHSTEYFTFYFYSADYLLIFFVIKWQLLSSVC